MSKPKKMPTGSIRREQALLLELQTNHGYGLSSLKPSDRAGMLFSFQHNTLTPVRFVKLAVPATSALGKALVENDKAERRRLRAGRLGAVRAPRHGTMKGRR